MPNLQNVDTETLTTPELLQHYANLAEAAGDRLRAAINALVPNVEGLAARHLLDELKGAAADAYDAAVDLPLALAQRGAAHTLDDVWADVQTLLERTEPVVTNVQQPVSGIDDLQESGVHVPVDEPETSRYGVRLGYANGEELDYDDVVAVQVYDKMTATFPFGFLELEVDTPNPDGSHELTREYRPGFWKPEDGEFVPFSAVEAPNPNGGW